MSAKYLAFTVSSKNGRSLDAQWQDACRTYEQRYGVPPKSVIVHVDTAVPEQQAVTVEAGTRMRIPGGYWYFSEPQQEAQHETQA